MPNDYSAPGAHFVHALLRARDWQERPELTQVCDWWRAGGKGVLALVGIGGAGKTAMADRFVRSLPGVTESESHQPQDTTLPVPEGLFVFSFYDAPNPEYFFDALYDWLVTAFQVADRRRVTDIGVRIQASASLVMEALSHTREKLLLVLDGLETVQDDGSRNSVFGHIEDSGLRAFLQRAAAGLQRALAVLVTTRFVLDDLEYERESGNAPHFVSVSVEEIADAACIALLRHQGVRGGDDVLRSIGRACGRHALTVDLVGGYLVYFHNGDPDVPLNLPTLEELKGLATHERDHQLRHIAEQTARFSRIAMHYHAALEQSDPAALALLQRLCLFRLGTDAAMLTRIFTGPDKEAVSGPALAALSPAEVQAKLNLLVDMRLLERGARGMAPGTESRQSTIYRVHLAVRNGFLNSLDAAAARRGHDAAREGLIASLGSVPDGGMRPSDPATLDLLEEVVYHTLHAGHMAEAWNIYWYRIGAYAHLGWRLGAYARGERICRVFATQAFPQVAPGLDTPPLRHAQAACLSQWGLYLKDLGRLDTAVHCHTTAIEITTQQEDHHNTSVNKANLAEVWLLSGRLMVGLHDAAEALHLAERVNHALSATSSYAYRGHAYAQRGEINAALADFRQARAWQQKFESRNDRPLYSLRGVLYSSLLARLGRLAEAMQLTEANKEILLKSRGPQDHDVPKCCLVLADLARRQGNWEMARNAYRQAHSWALERDAQEVLCWSALVQAQIELDAASGQPSHDHAAVCRHALADGLRIARECGYGIFYIDLLLVRAQLALLIGDADAALADIETALTTGHQSPPSSGLPTLRAATHPECGYVWGEAEARHLRAEARLLQAARDFCRPDFVPAKRDQLPPEVHQRIEEARAELTRCRALRQRIQDPKVHQTDDVLDRLNGGELTRYPYMLASSALLVPVPQTAKAQSADRSVPMPAKKHVFISYCRDNATEVAQLRNDLLAAGEPVWWDQDILPGQDWKRAIRQAMRDSYAVLLCLSQEAAARTRSGIFPEALDAIAAYREYAPGSIYLIPVRLSDCTIPSIEIDDVRTLDRIQHVDLFPAAQRANGLQRLIAAIQATPDHP